MTFRIISELFAGPRRDGTEYGRGMFEPTPYLFYNYRWGQRPIERGGAVEWISITPAVLEEKSEGSGMQHFESLAEAKQYCEEVRAEGATPSLVITVRIGGPESSMIVNVERADYPGYLHSMTFASQLTGVEFNILNSSNDSLITEEHESLGYKIRALRKARRQGKGLVAAILEIEIREDFRQRHFRNIT